MTVLCDSQILCDQILCGQILCDQILCDSQNEVVSFTAEIMVI